MIENELTEEEKELLEIDTNKKKYKILKKYLISDEYIDLLAKYNKEAERILSYIEDELYSRRNGKEVKATQSELNLSLLLHDFLIELSKEMLDDEAGKILKEDFIEGAKNVYTHITNKIEELYDVPSYSDLDILKRKRIEYALLNDRIEQIVEHYNEEKTKINNPNPYEN